MINIRRFLLLICLSVIGYLPAHAAGYYSLSDPQLYEVQYIWEIRNSGGTATDYKISVPIADMTESPPYQQLLYYTLEPSGLKPKLKKEQAEYIIPKVESGQTITIRHTYTFKNYAIEHQLRTYYGGFNIEAKYLNEEMGIESNNKQIIDLAQQLTSKERYPLDKAKKIFEYVNSSITYEFGKELSNSAIETLNRGYGSCEGFSLLYIALCRASGIPARFVFGYRFKPEEISRTQTDLQSFGHAWVEIYLPGISWVTVDPTYNYLLNGVKQVNYNYFGRVLPDDRHLFINYSHEPLISSSWTDFPKKSAKINNKTLTVIRRIR